MSLDTMLNANAYKGYLICHSSLTDETWVERDGTLIAWVANAAMARVIIDEIVNDTCAR